MDVRIAVESTRKADDAAHLAVWLNAAGWSSVKVWGNDRTSLELNAANVTAVAELKQRLETWIADRPEAESVIVVVSDRPTAPSESGAAVFSIQRSNLREAVSSDETWLAELDAALSSGSGTLADGSQEAAAELRNEREDLAESDRDVRTGHAGYFGPDSLARTYHAALSERAREDLPESDGDTPEQVGRGVIAAFTHLVRAARGMSALPITIYLSDEGTHEQVEAAVEHLVALAGLQITRRADPIVGSWFRRMGAAVNDAARSPAGREVALTAAHVADARLVLAQDAAITATFLQNLAPVISALQPTKDAVVRMGAVLLVKVDWAVSVNQLTAAQQAILDHDPRLALAPNEILTALSLTPAAEHSASR